MNEEKFKYIIREQYPRTNYDEIVLICDSEEFAKTYIAKYDGNKHYLSYKKIPYRDDDISTLAVENVITTDDGIRLYDIESKVLNGTYLDLQGKDINKLIILEKTIKAVDDKVEITVIANRILSNEEAFSILKENSKQCKETLPFKYEYKVGDEVTDKAGDMIGYVTYFNPEIREDEVKILVTKGFNSPHERYIEIKYIRPTGRFSTQIANVFSGKVKVDKKKEDK